METFTDPRDGNNYKTIQIGNQIWMAENLKYQGVDHRFPGRDSDNLNKYGCLYTWENAIKACPPGWRLPTKEELEELFDQTGGHYSSRLRDESWKEGCNSSGFSALPAGFWVDILDYFCFDFRACFWSATLDDSKNAYYLDMGDFRFYILTSGLNPAYSVRCVKDSN